MTLDLVKTAALLLALCLLQGINTRAFSSRRRTFQISAGLIFGAISVFGMMIPVAIAPGLIFDGRSAVLGMAGFFGGPMVGIIAALIAGSYRAWLGGSGAVVGIGVICASTLLGLIYRTLVRHRRVTCGPWQFLLFGLVVHLLAILLFTLLPAAQWHLFISELALPYLLVLVPTTAALGMLLQDIENRQQTERALAGSEARLRAITHALPDLALLLDEDGTYLEVVSQDERLLVAESSKLVGRRMHELLPTGLADKLLAAIRRALQATHVENVEYDMRTLSGPRTFEGRCKALDMELNGKPAVLFMARDISERCAAEQERRIAAIAFESQQGMIITDAAGVILKVNQAFSAITGYDETEVIGKHTRMLGSGRHNPAFYRDMWDSLLRNGNWQGEVWNRRKNGEIYPQALAINAVRSDDGTSTHYVAALSDISLRKSTEEEIRTLAFFDHLTQLPNRRLLMDRLGQALSTSNAQGGAGALMFIDLDDFRNINDLLGHHNGDVLLQQAARRLGAIAADIGANATVARFGGDEFVILLDALALDRQAAYASANDIAERILAALKAPYVLEGQTRRSSASIGVALFPASGGSVDELMKRADLAMNEAKHRGKGKLRFYDPVMQETVTARLRLEDDIRTGTEAGEFTLLYQPQFGPGCEMVGVEALVRWQHPLRGFIAPDQFIHVAERAGLMPALGLMVLNRACEQLAAWALDPVTAGLTVAVNVSAQQLYNDEFVDQVLDALHRSGAPAGRLTLELTESLLLDDMEEAIERMGRLRTHGIRFSIDDFGTGYSSLAYLQRLPLDQLKIDRSFVQDLPHSASSLAIVKAIIALAQALDLKVIAEGVELDTQRDTLRANGCHHFQGFLFARPMTAEQIGETKKALPTRRLEQEKRTQPSEAAH
ncbi:EAL domain-containing protein [Azoarcus sp. L1K30]|uniref:EAL domain-containing protein n=1 Tax=Azoarcus sp. L1K30 TaxID=2820277 RepID=UPI001B8259D1|nr:EAL domain-containing protein [Azoarcus sp. L1K30]MBR0566749.1 EAL domain-containing protein [Azoarcus sp. L1K30]